MHFLGVGGQALKVIKTTKDYEKSEKIEFIFLVHKRKTQPLNAACYDASLLGLCVLSFLRGRDGGHAFSAGYHTPWVGPGSGTQQVPGWLVGCARAVPGKGGDLRILAQACPGRSAAGPGWAAPGLQEAA